MEARLQLGAPLALTGDGLLLAGPDPLAAEEPGLFADAAAPAADDPSPPPAVLLPPAPLDPADDPLSPVGDPAPGEALPIVGLSSCGCGPTITVGVYALAAADEETPAVPGKFRFFATASCLVGAPASVSISYALGGSATPNTDYTGPLTSGSVTVYLVNGTGIAEPTFNAVDDMLVEGDETVRATINPGSYEIDPLYPWGETWVYDNEPTVWISAPEYLTEGTDAYIEFTVERTVSYNKALTIPLTMTGTAQKGVDYGDPGGTVQLAAGQAIKVVQVSLTNDTTREWTETVIATLGEGQGYILDPNYKRSTTEIVDNDAPTVTLGATVLQVNNDDDNTNYVQDMTESGSVSGEDDLKLMTLAFPEEVKQGAEITLSAPTDKVSVWTAQTRGTAVLSGSTSAKTWIVGSETVPTQLWVEAVAGSSSVDDVEITLSGTDATAVNPPIRATSLSGDDKATNVGVTIRYGGQDVTGKKTDVLVGQFIDMYAEIIAPPEWKQNPTYQWTVPGPAIRDYVANATFARVIHLGDAHGGTDQELLNGLKQANVKYLWATAAGNPDQHIVSVNVGNINGANYVTKTRFGVYRPTSTMTVTAAGAVTLNIDGQGRPIVILTDPVGQTNGIEVLAGVQLPQGFNEAGQWQFVQTVNLGRWRTLQIPAGQRQAINLNGQVVLDTYFGAPTVGGGPAVITTGPEGATFGDSPFEPLANTRSLTIDEDFSLFVMFRPPGATSRWVPLKSLDWEWHAQVDAQGQNWVLGASGGPNPVGPFEVGWVDDIPVWLRNASEWMWEDLP